MSPTVMFRSVPKDHSYNDVKLDQTIHYLQTLTDAAEFHNNKMSQANQ